MKNTPPGSRLRPMARGTFAWNAGSISSISADGFPANTAR